MEGHSSVLDRSKYLENISVILQESSSPLDPQTYETTSRSNLIKSAALKQDLFRETLQHEDLLNVSSLVDSYPNQNVKKIGIDPKIYTKNPKKQFLQSIGQGKAIDCERQKIKVERSQRPRLIATERLNDHGNDIVEGDYDDYSEFFKKGKE
jgi:hypothetical protein